MARLSPRGPGMGRYFLRRLLQTVPLLLGITLLTFALMRLAAGDAVELLYERLGTSVSQEVLDARRAELGLDRPFLVQYASWLGGLFRGDLGTSYVSGRPVWSALSECIPSTLRLAAASLGLTVLISVPLGIATAVHRGSVLDGAVRVLSFAGSASPSFLTALVLLLVFAVRLRWLPVIDTGGGGGLVLPAVTLAVAMSSRYVRQIRAAVLEELEKGYVAGARARGVSESAILWGSVLRTAMGTMVTLLALSLGSLLGGTAVVETIFRYNGVGRLAAEAISMHDDPILLSCVLWTALVYTAVNLGADLLCRLLDARVRPEGGART